MPRLLPTLAIAALAAIAGPAAAQTGGGGSPTGTTPTTPAPAPPPPPPALKVEKPSPKLFIREGQPNRLRLGGIWYFRQDDALQGEPLRYFSQRSLVGWSAITVPHNWNGADTVFDAQGVGWYRKEFKLPKAPKGRRWRWIVRFESVHARGTVWLNGRKIGSGGPSYLPFELDLKGLRKGRNRLVVRVSNRRGRTDLTHWHPYGRGDWWNFGGISREVYVRPVETVDIQDLAVTPRLRCVRCSARVDVSVVLRNLSRKRRRVAVTLVARRKGAAPTRVELSPRVVRANSTREVHTSFRIRKPRLWRPGRPNLYKLTASAAIRDEQLASFVRYFGVRQIKRLRDGRVLLNGRQLQLRGASVHEDDRSTGAALTPRQRSQLLHDLRRLGATVTRAQYPLHPAFLEACDRLGIMVWSMAPVYQLTNPMLDIPSVRRAALSVTRRMVLRDRSHPSVLAWSLGNELAQDKPDRGAVGPGFARYVADGARAVRKLDRTRLVALDRHGRLGETTYVGAFNTLDAIGIHDYFGWYRTAPDDRPPTTSSEFGPFLDGLHAAHPSTALFVTEYGAEGTGHGPATERGTFEFQTHYALEHLAIHASRRYVNGSIYWALKDFRVTPGWLGGNSPARSTPPWHNKSLIDESGAPKPVFFEMRKQFRRTRPLR